LLSDLYYSIQDYKKIMEASDVFLEACDNASPDKEFSEESESLTKDQSDDKSFEDRETWRGKTDFLVSCVGFAVGLGNVWRFPYLCYKNGGGAFLIPYIIFIIFAGIPLFLLEVSLGQFMKQGGIGIWNICPLMKGIGFSSTVIVFYCNTYYIMVLTWSMYYFFLSINKMLPWATCGNVWNTEKCFDYTNLTDANTTAFNYSGILLNQSIVTVNESLKSKSSVVEFWENEVLQITNDITEIGGIRTPLLVCLALAWIICFVCVFKGIRTTGKIVYFTALFPYIVLFIFLVRGLTLEGSLEGVTYYIKPNWTKLHESQVWADAGTQVFFSYAIGLGALPALGSYNKYHSNFLRDSIIIAAVNSFTSLLAGFVVFSFLGYMSEIQKVPIKDIATSGPGLAFIVYPKAVTSMPIAPFWSCLFFFMIFLIGLDSQFVGVEGFLTAVIDFYPTVLRKRRTLLAAGSCFIFFLIGLSMITQGGMYVFQIFDYYSASGLTLLFLAASECVSVAWIYGTDKYMKNLKDMLGYKPSSFLSWCWKLITPGLALGVLVYSIVTHEALTYNKTYTYPWWAIMFGLMLAFSSMVCIPAYAILKLYNTTGVNFKQRFRRAIKPKYGSHHMDNISGRSWFGCKNYKMKELCMEY